MSMDFAEINKEIPEFDGAAAEEAKKRWDSIAKPLGSLGKLEALVIRMAGVMGDARVDAARRVILVCCADNGVVAEGVTQTGPEVTAIVAEQILLGKSSVCRMARVANTEVYAADFGMLRRVKGMRDLHVKDGTADMAKGPAMTCAEAERAIFAGMELAREYKEKGYRLLGTGEMGIGNTTSSSALASVLLEMPVELVTGRGAGLSDEKLQRKVEVIRKAIAVNRPDAGDALDALAKVGGLDIAGMAGVFIGGALQRMPVVIDGLISSVAALVAGRLCPACRAAMLGSHESAEPAAQAILRELGAEPILRAEMRLGEGTGAACLFPLIDMALAVYGQMEQFEDMGIEAYTPQGGELAR